MDAMLDTNTVDWKALVLREVQGVNEELKALHTGFAQISAELRTFTPMMRRLEKLIEKLEKRDDAQQENINTLNLNQHRLEAAVGGLTAAHTECTQLSKEFEHKHALLDSNYAQIVGRVEDLEEAIVSVKDEQEFHEKWSPWLEAIKWVILGVAGVAVAAIAFWLLKDLAASIVANGVP